MTIFVDSNLPMYVAGSAHPNKKPAKLFLEKVRSRQVDACTSTEVLQEILYRYCAMGYVDLAAQVYELFVEICPVVLPVTLADTERCRDLLVTVPKIGVRDSLHAAVMLNNGVSTIATFDRGFDEIPGVERVALTG